LLHRGTVEQVVSKRLLSTSFIAAMPTEQQQRLKARFEQIVFDFTGLSTQDQIDFPYTTFAYHFRKHQIHYRSSRPCQTSKQYLQ
jgi:hypothetical protein